MIYSPRFESFWLKYQTKQKGPKRKAYESWKKVCKAWSKEEGFEDDEVKFSQHVFRGYDALIKNRTALERARHFVAQLPHAVTFLNQYRFEDEFQTSTGDLKREVVDHKCGCGSTAVIGRSVDGGWICGPCDIDDWKNGRLASGITPSLEPLLSAHPKVREESWRDWSMRVLKTMPAGRALLERYGQ